MKSVMLNLVKVEQNMRGRTAIIIEEGKVPKRERKMRMKVRNKKKEEEQQQWNKMNNKKAIDKWRKRD